MARETKAQKEARQTLETQILRTAQTAEANENLMSLFERANKVGFDLFVSDGKFVMKRNYNYEEWVLPRVLEYSDLQVFYSLESAVEMREEEIAESERRNSLYNSAIGKLTKEEREVLGV